MFFSFETILYGPFTSFIFQRCQSSVGSVTTNKWVKWWLNGTSGGTTQVVLFKAVPVSTSNHSMYRM